MFKNRIKSAVWIAVAMAFIGVSTAYAMDNIRTYVPNAQKVGTAKMRVMLWDIYQATLYAPNGDWSFDKPFALRLKYLRHLDGHKIADRSVQEMRGQGFSDEVKLATWHTQMRDIFPDVNEGDVINGVYMQEGQTIFYEGDQELGRINDPEFSRRFFSIWLSTKTSAPEIRLSLLGLEQGDRKGINDNEMLKEIHSNGDGRYD